VKELLAFFVLGGPLGPLLLIAIIGAIAIVVVVRKLRGVRARVTAALMITLAITLTLTWDILLGKNEYHRLCETESGIRIYKRVKLELEYRAVEFTDNFYTYRQLPMARRYPVHLTELDDLPGPAKIERVRYVVSDASTGEALGSLTRFFYHGGWFENHFRISPGGGVSCGSEGGGLVALMNNIFEH
jgi:hypothetical protein